jgi:dienelactone hydrolase
MGAQLRLARWRDNVPGARRRHACGKSAGLTKRRWLTEPSGIWRSARAAAAASVTAALIFLAPAAGAVAQTWLAPADPGQAFLGPGNARGAVVWSHGRSAHSEDYLAPTPPYAASLRQSGWDTYRFNRLRDHDTLPDSARALAAAVHEIKGRGYRHVVLAGQSFGAFLSLMAAGASDEVDTVIATAPAAFGTFFDSYDIWRQNASRLYPLLDRIRGARVMLFFFHGDDFDPGGRNERSREILEARRTEYIIVDQPAGLVGHWAAATKAFADRFGRCMLDFAEARVGRPDTPCDREEAGEIAEGGGIAIGPGPQRPIPHFASTKMPSDGAAIDPAGIRRR